MKVKSLGLPAALLAASMFAACQNTARGIQQDTEKNTDAAKQAGRDAGNKAEDAARDTKGTAGNAADATRDASANAAQNTKDAANSLGAKIDAAQQTMDVKTALMADKTVDASGIDVDSNADTKTVTLKGHVKTAAEKQRAAEIAKAKAPGYTVDNNLTISAH
jgi:hyperosmotically inducible periplasmic protein